jgi:hypothetical protein
VVLVNIAWVLLGFWLVAHGVRSLFTGRAAFMGRTGTGSRARLAGVIAVAPLVIVLAIGWILDHTDVEISDAGFPGLVFAVIAVCYVGAALILQKTPAPPTAS